MLVSRRGVLLGSFTLGLVAGLAARSNSPGNEAREGRAPDQKAAEDEEGAVEAADEVERPAAEDEGLNGHGSESLHARDCGGTQVPRTRFSLREGVDEIFKAGVGWTLAFGVVVAVYAGAVALRDSTETLEVTAVVVSGLAAVVFAEGLMDIVLRRLSYAVLGLLMAAGVGVAATHLEFTRWLHGWGMAGGLTVVLLGLAVLSSRARRRRRSDGASSSSANSPRLRLQLFGLFLVTVALALQARLAVFEHPANAQAAEVIQQKVERLPTQMLNTGDKKAAILSRVSMLEREVCRLEKKTRLSLLATCRKGRSG